ncbi:MAG: glutamate--tRNA ligase [Proteobacteria bacterium]|nr:glutamate--tRNA ligase [Pseudomonadota bacterium]
MKPRVRFAPSPTGALHIGGARTALFNWLFARHTGGTFLLRIEDTDVERSTKEFEQSILDGLRWLGMDWDGELVYQSQRMELYREHVQRLLDEGKAYRCTCSPEELEAKRQQAMAEGRKPKYDGTCRNGPAHPGRPAAVRFRSPEQGSTSFHDICRGTITFENSELDDLIISRSDGTPTYNFTVVVDDVTMRMTHIIRGDDHINNTPRQVLLYQALDYPIPEFAHLPMIHGPDRKKLSKRHGATSVIEYQSMGYLPDAMVNYLARLGWSCGDQEIFTRDELIEKFDLVSVGSSPSIFDMEKLGWVNSQHMARQSDERIADMTAPFLEGMGLSMKDRGYSERALASEREKAKTLKELAELSAFYFRESVEIDPKAGGKWLAGESGARLRRMRSELAGLDDWSEGRLAALFERMLAELGCKMLDLAQPIRVSLTGSTASPGIYLVLSILGRERSLARIDAALAAHPA